jgi:hypothetical protein
LAAGGILAALIMGRRRAPHLRILAFLVLDWSLLAFLQPWGFGNLRQPFVLQVFLILYAAYGLERFLHLLFDRLAAQIKKPNLPVWERLTTFVAVIVVTMASARSAVDFMAVTSHESDFSVPAQAGAWLRMRLTQDDAILVLTDDTFQVYALATYVQLPFDSILDDRLDRQLIHSRLASADLVYVVELYKSKAGLSGEESHLLDELESGRTPAQEYSIGSTRIWIVAKDAPVSSQ